MDAIERRHLQDHNPVTQAETEEYNEVINQEWLTFVIEPLRLVLIIKRYLLLLRIRDK